MMSIYAGYMMFGGNDLLSMPLQRLFANGRMLSTVLTGLERRLVMSPTAVETTSRLAKGAKDPTSIKPVVR